MLADKVCLLPWRSGHTWWGWCRRRCWRWTWCGCARKEIFNMFSYQILDLSKIYRFPSDPISKRTVREIINKCFSFLMERMKVVCKNWVTFQVFPCCFLWNWCVAHSFFKSLLDVILLLVKKLFMYEGGSYRCIINSFLAENLLKSSWHCAFKFQFITHDMTYETSAKENMAITFPLCD